MPSRKTSRGGVCKVMQAREKEDIVEELRLRRDDMADFAEDIEKGLKVSQTSMNREIGI